MRQNLNNGIRGSNQIDVRERNERLAYNPEISGSPAKAEIARKTGYLRKLLLSLCDL